MKCISLKLTDYVPYHLTRNLKTTEIYANWVRKEELKKWV